MKNPILDKAFVARNPERQKRVTRAYARNWEKVFAKKKTKANNHMDRKSASVPAAVGDRADDQTWQ